MEEKEVQLFLCYEFKLVGLAESTVVHEGTKSKIQKTDFFVNVSF
jgi:hypothetical protein